MHLHVCIGIFLISLLLICLHVKRSHTNHKTFSMCNWQLLSSSQFSFNRITNVIYTLLMFTLPILSSFAVCIDIHRFPAAHTQKTNGEPETTNICTHLLAWSLVSLASSSSITASASASPSPSTSNSYSS